MWKSKLDEWAYDGSTELYNLYASKDSIVRHSIAYTNKNMADSKIDGALHLLKVAEEATDTSTILGGPSGGMCKSAKELLDYLKSYCGKSEGGE